MNKSVCQGTRQLTMMEYENRNILGNDQKGSRHDTPKYAAGIGSFWTEGKWKETDIRKALCPPHPPGQLQTLISPEKAPENLTNKHPHKTTFIFHEIPCIFTFSQFSTPKNLNHFILFCHFCTNLLFFYDATWAQGLISPLSYSLLFLLHECMIHVLMHFVFSLLICLLLV